MTATLRGAGGGIPDIQVEGPGGAAVQAAAGGTGGLPEVLAWLGNSTAPPAVGTALMAARDAPWQLDSGAAVAPTADGRVPTAAAPTAATRLILVCCVRGGGSCDAAANAEGAGPGAGRPPTGQRPKPSAKSPGEERLCGGAWAPARGAPSTQGCGAESGLASSAAESLTSPERGRVAMGRSTWCRCWLACTVSGLSGGRCGCVLRGCDE